MWLYLKSVEIGITLMGVYLAAPIKDKNIKKSITKPLPYISAEMQGIIWYN